MLIWLKHAAPPSGLEHGVLRAGQAQTVLQMEHVHEATQRHAQHTLASAREEARGIVEQARTQAAALLATAHAQVEAACQKGYEEGTRRAVLEWHERQAEQAMAASRSMRGMHEKLAEIVTTAVERIVSSESRGALYQRALKNVQTLTRGASALTLRVSPADYEHARDGLASLGPDDTGGLKVEVQVDPGLRAGSCVFESEQGVLDASLQTQLDGLRVAMERAARRAVAEG